MSESATESAPPGTCTYATRSPSPSPAQTGATWLCSEQQTTGIPPSPSASCAFSSTCRAAHCSGE